MGWALRIPENNQENCWIQYFVHRYILKSKEESLSFIISISRWRNNQVLQQGKDAWNVIMMNNLFYSHCFSQYTNKLGKLITGSNEFQKKKTGGKKRTFYSNHARSWNASRENTNNQHVKKNHRNSVYKIN